MDDVPEESWGEISDQPEDSIVEFKIVLMRCGEQEWLSENKIGSWFGTKLTSQGRYDITEASDILKNENYTFDLAYCSTLRNCKESLAIILEHLGLEDIETQECWQLNERHFGALTGQNKLELALKYGQEQFDFWTKRYDQAPPPMAETHKYFKAIYNNPALKNHANLPKSESIRDLEKRTVEFWNKTICPRLLEGRQILIVTHWDFLRSLVEHLDEIEYHYFEDTAMPRCVPFYYKLDETLQPIHEDSYLKIDHSLLEIVRGPSSLSSINQEAFFE